MGEAVVLALSTCPDDGAASRIAAALVEEQLAACVNRVPGVRSIYFWEGRLQDDHEILLMIKTTADRLPALTERLQSLHPYDLPEVVAIPVVGGNEAYLQWVRDGVNKNRE